MAESKIAAAVGVIVGSNSKAPEVLSRSKQVEKAMSQAVLDCLANGILDPDLQKIEMQKAREKVLKGKG